MMNFTLIVCTFKRAKPLLKLLQSVQNQTAYPFEIIIVDGSSDSETEAILKVNEFKNLIYYSVPPEHRGLTKQRNYGIARVNPLSEIVCFLDDDIVLEPTYFEEIFKTYIEHPNALGVGGYTINEIPWTKVPGDYSASNNDFMFDGWKRKESSRFILRKKLGLDTDVPPGYLPEFSNGRSVGFLPPSGKVYEVEQLMGGVSSFRTAVFEQYQFSTYFEGYGLYEDADFTLRLSKTGSLYLNTNAQLFHYHDPSGRPNQYQYGKMVVRNGWYIWRVKYPKPSFKAQLKWHAIILVLTAVRFINIFTTTKRKEAATETLGRVIGWIGLLFNKPREK